MLFGFPFQNNRIIRDSSPDIEIWGSEDDDEEPDTDGQLEYDTDVSPPKPGKSSIVKVVGFICTFLLSWQALFRIPDGAIGVLLKFIGLTLLKLSEIMGCEDLKTIHKLFPNSLKRARCT